MKRNWKFDYKAPVGVILFWKGNPEKIKCPWIKIDEKPYLIHPERGLEKNLHMIKKVSNLEWLELQVDKNK
jgi:hypothetical protein